MSASAEAIDAARRALAGKGNMQDPEPWVAPEIHAKVATVAGAMHDPALGLDRSVCLRDVRTALAERFTGHGGDCNWLEAAHMVEREFGGGG